MPEPWRFTVFSVVRGIFRSTWNKRFGFACCGECSTMIPRPFGLGIFCGGRYRTCTRSGLPFRSSCLPVQQEKEQQKSSSAEAELPGLRYGVNQRLLNWGARRAAFRPYFLRSFIRGSRVITEFQNKNRARPCDIQGTEPGCCFGESRKNQSSSLSSLSTAVKASLGRETLPS